MRKPIFENHATNTGMVMLLCYHNSDSMYGDKKPFVQLFHDYTSGKMVFDACADDYRRNPNLKGFDYYLLSDAPRAMTQNDVKREYDIK